MNYYPFHIGDYLSATRHLSWEEDSAYRRLLDVYYTSEKPLPTDLRAVCRLILATTDGQREAVRIVLEEFFSSTDIGWVNHRADAEIAAMREKQQKQRDKANKMWDKRRAAEHVTESGKASAMPQHGSNDATASNSDANALPPTPTPTPTPSKKDTAREARFDPVAYLIERGVEPQVAKDWVAGRKKRPTLTAIEGIEREAEKAGWTLTEALREGCARAWEGFKAEWLRPEQRGQRVATSNEPAWRIEQRQRTQAAAPGVAVRDGQHQDAGDFFDVEARNVQVIER